MKVVNYNDEIRKYLSNLIFEISKEDKNYEYIDLFYNLYDNIKNGSGIYDYILGLVFESTYLVTKLSLTMYPEDKDLLKNILYLKSFSNIGELKDRLTINIFKSFLEDVSYFYDSDVYYKRNLVERSIEDKSYLMKFFPCFLIDAFSYLNRYDAMSVLEEYHERKRQNDNDAFNTTVQIGVEDLINLEKKDFDAYKYVILEMIESFYVYKKYLLSNNLLYDEFDIDIISMIEEDLISTIYFSISNITLLQKIVSGYLGYNILPPDKINEIHNFNNKNNKKNFTKVMEKSYKLKNEKK